jgi:drug/metabolite transporter (DMT)-like permease
VNWLVGDGQAPASLPEHALWSIVYLAVAGSVVGLILYFYVLRHVQASRMALVTPMTPVIALFLGQWLNEEIIGKHEWLGVVVILVGLAVYEWGGQWRHLSLTRGAARA